MEMPSYQGLQSWMIWVAAFAVVVLCGAFAVVWKAVEINRAEKTRKREEIAKIAKQTADEKIAALADDISKKVTESFKEKFDSIDEKLAADKNRLEAQERRSMDHDKALERIEETLERVDTNIRDIREGYTYLARGTIATLNHQIHNGNTDELDAAASELNRYLTARPIVPI